jgi:hypothetical protein
MQQDPRSFLLTNTIGSVNHYNLLQLSQVSSNMRRRAKMIRFVAKKRRHTMRVSISSCAFSRLAGAVTALWLCGAGAAWAGGGGESLTTLQAVIGPPDGSSGFCHMLKMNPCPQLPTFTQAILEAAGLANSPPEMVAAQNGLSPGNNVYAGNPAAVPPTPFPLTANTPPTLSDLLSTLTPLAFISSTNQNAPAAATQLYDPDANTFLYAVTVSSIEFATPPGGTVPDTLYLFYEDLSRTNSNLKGTVANFSLPLTVLNSDGTERAVAATLQFAAAGANDCSTSTIKGNFSGSGTQTISPAAIGVNCAVVFSSSPTSSQKHATFEVAVPLLVTGACSPATPGCPRQPPPPPNTDPAYFYALHTGNPGQLNLGIYTAFLFDDLGATPTKSGILPSGATIGIAPTAGPLGPATTGSATFALCANLPGGNGNGQAPVPAVAAYYAIATSGETLLSRALSSTSVCPAF